MSLARVDTRYLSFGLMPTSRLYAYAVDQGRATSSERGPDETFRSSSWAGVINENPYMRMLYITILLLQSRQISETAGAACHEEVFQCPARWMSSTTEECHRDGGQRAGNHGDTSRTSFWRRAVRNSIGAAKHGYDALNMRNVFRKIPRREHDIAEEGLWRRVIKLRFQFIIAQ